jgi:hypothetical protein
MQRAERICNLSSEFRAVAKLLGDLVRRPARSNMVKSLGASSHHTGSLFLNELHPKAGKARGMRHESLPERVPRNHPTT